MANSWTILKEILGSDKKWIGKVISTNNVTKKTEILPIGSITPLMIDSNGTVYANDTYVSVEGGIIVGQSPQIGEATKEIIS